MKRIIYAFVIMFMIINSLFLVVSNAEEYPALPDFKQDHYIIYREASRDNRIELVAFNIKNETAEDCIVWDNELQILDGARYIDDEKWYLDGDSWVKFEEGYYCISNNPYDVIESDMEVKDLRKELDIDYDKLEKLYIEDDASYKLMHYDKIWDGDKFIWFTYDDKLKTVLNYSNDGVTNVVSSNLGKEINVGSFINIENGSLVLSVGEYGGARLFRFGSYSNSPLYILNDKYEIIGTKEFTGYSTFLCKADGVIYIKNSDYTNITSQELRSATGYDPFEKTIVTYYKTRNGFEWEEVTEEDASAVNSKSKEIQQNFLPYNVLNYGQTLQPKNDLSKLYDIIYENKSKRIVQGGILSARYYELCEQYGSKVYGIDDYGNKMTTSRLKKSISLNGLYSVNISRLSDFFIWYNNEYMYIDGGRDELYRLPMKYLTDDIIVVYQNKALAFNTPPVLESDRTLVPMRFLFEQMGAEVIWNEATNTATAKMADKVVTFSIDNTTATVNGEAKEMDVPARLINDKTLVPLRFLSENLGYTVTWDEATNTAIIE